MALFFLLAGLVLVVTGVNGTLREAGALLKGDFQGPNNFFVWGAAILIAGAFGYIPKFRPISYGFLTLVFVVILLSSGSGFFDQFKEAMDKLTSGEALKPRQDVIGGGDRDMFANIGWSSELQNFAASQTTDV